MKYNQLGKTGVLVPELCFGTMTFFGKGYWENIGKVHQDEANILIKTAFDNGIISLILQMHILREWLKNCSEPA